ncbi:hypothetical protein ACFWF4_12925 [Nocardiopsis flavescens]|uniref:hypothetical protein n=1 Tax=Nocardiopsis flavescens TaxID=758803 RepID=UPI00365BDF59
MSTPMPPGAGGERLPTAGLDDVEAATEAAIADAVQGAVGAQDATGRGLRGAGPQVVEAITRGARRSVTVGAAMARALTPARDLEEIVAEFAPVGWGGLVQVVGEPLGPLPGGAPRRRAVLPDQATVVQEVAGWDIPARVDETLARQAARLDVEPEARRPRRVGIAQRALWTQGLTLIHRAAGVGSAWFAGAFGLGLVWYTREDERVCPVCGPLHEVPIPRQGGGFVLPPPPGATWRGFTGLPPLHPRCRCFPRPRHRR